MTTMSFIACICIYVACLAPQVYTAVIKRQGLFTCHGWGAGCDVDWRPVRVRESRPETFEAPDSGPVKESNRPIKAQSASKTYTPTFLFTSGSSWTPIGKRSQRLDALRQLPYETGNQQASNDLLPLQVPNYSYDP